MALPSLIEIVPVDKPVQARITVPGSKSVTNRSLILAALADGETRLEGALWSEDTQVMVDALRKLGFELRVENDPEEFCNRTITIKGLAGKIPRTGTESQPLELFVGNAGTAARFLGALVCLGAGVYRLHGVARMHERPQAELFRALRELGYRIEPEHKNERLPARFFGSQASAVKRSGMVSLENSSQFASALLLCSEVGGWQMTVVGENAEESPYVAMTAELIKRFPKHGGTFRVEADASSGSYFLAADKILPQPSVLEHSRQLGVSVETPYLNTVLVSNWPDSGWQIDERFPQLLRQSAAGDGGGKSTGRPLQISRIRDLGDSIMMAIVLAPLGAEPVHFTDLGRLRVQECERVQALRRELSRCGAGVVEIGDTLEISPSPLHGAEIETYDDHRMAMCFAVLGLKVPGIKIQNPACVKKTFPNFFQKLAQAPPHGLGATILDGSTGKALHGDELFAE